MSEYITDENFDGDLEAVRAHYERCSDVYRNLATLGEHPTIGFAGNAGWYQDEPVTKPSLLEDGWEKRTRCTTFERDWEAILDDQLGADDRGREIFNISSWKDADALSERKLSTAPPEREWRDGKATPDYDELRGFGFWFDLDLDNKEGRTALTEEELRRIERVQQRVIEAVADAYGVGTGDIYGLDSGGGAYIYGPPEATLPITEHLDAPERGWVLEDINDKINDGPLTEQVEAIIEDEGAGDLLDPDWIQNKNRQTKAPGAIHHNHDIVVTPLRQRDPATGKVAGEARYRPTRVSALTQADIKELEVWADGLTAIEHTDAVNSLVRSMYPELAQNHDTWKAIIDERAAHLRDVREREQQRREETKQQIAEWVTNEDTPLEHPDSDADAAGSLRGPSGLYSGAEIVTKESEFNAALETIDVRDVVKHHASDAYDTSTRAHEITFDPAWRHSNSGKSCAIPSGGNVFIDNGANAGGGPVLAYALGEGLITGGADQSLSGTEFGKAIDAMRADGYQIPVFVPEAGNEYEQTPLWALRKAALALDVVESEDEFKEHETEDGETYLGFDAAAYSAVLSALDSAGVNHGRSQQTDEKDPRKQAIVRHNDEFESVEDVPDSAIQSTSDTDDTDASRTDDTQSEGPGWESVREMYMKADEDSDVKKGPARLKAQKQLEAETDWMHIMESERLWWYDGDAGLFKQYGERRIGSILTEKLGQHYSRAEKGEITDRLKESNNVHRSEINARHIGEPLLCVGNGVINLDTGEITEHSASYRFTRGIDIDYPTPENGLKSDTTAITDFIDEITQRTEDRDTLLDHLGHGLMPGHPYRAFVVCFGGGGNGKTQLARLFKGFVGEENTAAVEIDELANGDYATSDLPGKFINWGDDMSGDGGGSLDDISTLKKATGDSDIRCNEKYEKTFDFKNEAAMFFSANEPPRFGETKKSVKDRLYPIRMPYSFESDPDPDNPLEKEKTPRAADRLLEDDAAMRGLLELAVRHARQLRQNRGVYSMPEGPEERFKLYNEQADPIVRFANSMFTEGSESDRIAKQDAHSVYEIMMDIWEERSTSLDSFRRQFPKSTTIDIETGQSRTLAETEGERVTVWKRLQWSERAREFMPDWLTQRYAGHFDSDEAEETDTSESVQPEQPPLAGLDPGHGKTITATVANVSKGEYSREAQGKLKGPHDTVISFVVPGNNSNPMPAYQGDLIRFDGATLRTDDDGLRELVIDDAVDIEQLGVSPETDTDDDADGDSTETDTETPETTETPDSTERPQSSSEDTEDGEATADGGVQTDTQTDADTTQTDTDATASQSDAQEEERTDPTEMSQAERLGKIKGKLRYSDEPLTAAEIAEKLAWKVSKTEATLELLAKKSKSNVIERSDGYQMI